MDEAEPMNFYALLDQVVALLQQRGRLSYRGLKLQFGLDDDYIDAVKAELIDAQQLAVDAQGTTLVWTGPTAPRPGLSSDPAPAPISYTPPHLAEKILTLRHVLADERKQVTVLLVDVQGALEVLADRDPEEARTFLDPVYERLLAAVHRFEGTVTQVQHDGLLALFGAPLAHEDHAVRACYAALAMHEAIRRYSTEMRRTHGLEVQLRVGLHTGEVVVRSISDDLHMDYAALGTTLSLTTRLQQLAPPGSIRLTAETLRLVEGLMQVTPLGPIPIPGQPASGRPGGACRQLPRVGSHPLWGANTNWRRCARLLIALQPDTARWGRWWGSLGWASRACSMNSSTRIAPRAGSSWKAARSPMAGPRRISRSWTSSPPTSRSTRRMTDAGSVRK